MYVSIFPLIPFLCKTDALTVLEVRFVAKRMYVLWTGQLKTRYTCEGVDKAASGEEVQRAPPYLIFDKEQHGQKSIVPAQGEQSRSEGASERTPDTLQPIPTQTSKEWTDNAFDTSSLLDARPKPALSH
ncbi:hypothetical protein Baya_1531 [Bagarius yarrelli]|uniref:Uncharacterized protein n=1 Tax=Bagarius yarrelli TaxID=175774 RepID=A0A556TLC9_BAGYA|nr:hypothetical protein Baya_1531 [Bagarius yarrelli]